MTAPAGYGDCWAEKVARDFLSKGAALDLARLLLRDAPAALYGLDTRAGAAASGAAASGAAASGA